MDALSASSGKTILRPLINYSHVLLELSVNSKNPCEVIRELVSNSYDAQATEIRYYPLLQKELGGFIFFDNGQGMSDSVRIKGVTPYESFFSIGYSTKHMGDMIGYKCQGAKLAFACKTFMLITRCEGEEYWRYTSILDPRERLSQETDITPNYTNEPWEVLRENLAKNPIKATRRVFHSLNEDFFRNRFHHGTMIIILGFDMGRNFGRYFGTKNELTGKVKGAERYELSYIWNYIRFYTRHGDIRILNADVTDFSTIHRETLEEPVLSSEPPPKFYIWVDEDIDYGQEKFERQLKEVPPGFPYPVC